MDGPDVLGVEVGVGVGVGVVDVWLEVGLGVCVGVWVGDFCGVPVEDVPPRPGMEVRGFPSVPPV